MIVDLTAHTILNGFKYALNLWIAHLKCIHLLDRELVPIAVENPFDFPGFAGGSFSCLITYFRPRGGSVRRGGAWFGRRYGRDRRTCP